MVQMIAPDRRLKQKSGNSSIEDDLRSLDSLNGAFKKLSSEFNDVICNEILTLRSAFAAQDTQCLKSVYSSSHSLRGLSGSFSKPHLSQLADSLCRYIDSLSANSSADHRLIQAHINTISMFTANSEPNAEVINTILSALHNAVGKNTVA
ncbi:MAG: hypothetical protein JKY46_05525 [Robiginitomaculum sp.]|nr:hypothetical protein [Robiginitomaculum sp.]